MSIISNQKGIALITVYIVIAVLLAVGGTYFWRSFNEFRFAERESKELRAHYAAEAGLKAVGMDIYQAFRNSAAWQNNRNINAFRIWFGDIADTPAQRRATFLANHSASLDSIYPNFPVSDNIDNCPFDVILPSVAADPVAPTTEGVLIRLVAVGRCPYLGSTVRRVVSVTVSYEMKPSPIFNYAYFINNFGWMWGGGITVNGDVRSNGNFSFNGNPMVNGDIYAATNPDLGAAGTISGNTRNWDIAHYQNNTTTRARPTDPTDPANPTGTVYDAGYDGTSTRYEHQEVLDMPYLGDLNTYRQLASSQNGQITQGGAVLVNNVYSGSGPDGIAGTPDDGCIILNGTAANPVVINGPVVVDGDVIIRGVVSGQGSIYAGRNVHIVGDITYNNPPAWPKPDPTPQVTAQINSTRDFVGLACKGNVVIGDYTRNDWQVNCERFLRPPFTQGYVTDPTDASLGYDSDGDPTNGYWFNGDYTAPDGGSKDDGAGGSTQRKFYESSLSDIQIQAIAAPSNQIRNLDGITYNNHAYTGRVGAMTINGSIVSRDEAIVYSGNITMNYDVRAYGEGIESLDIYLPRDLSLPETRVSQSG